jgi:Ser/Thr protein kinase RdoA (MazF antagonist)
VKPYVELSPVQQARRHRRVALAALAAYPIDVARVRLLAAHSNTTWRVDTVKGGKLALRVGMRAEDTATSIDAELAWLCAVGETDIAVVRPVPNRHGDYVTRAAAEGVPEVRDCVLFEWMPGRPLSVQITPERYHLLGTTAAAMHDHGEGFTPPPGFAPLIWDRVFYYAREPVVWHERRFRRYVTPSRRRVIDEVIRRAGAELARLHESQPMVIHGDLHPDNVHVDRGRLIVFDFEDVMWGFPVQDIAITLFYERDRPDYSALCEAFEAGYRTRRPWPVEFDGQLDVLMAARTVMFINYVLRTDPEPGPYIALATRRLRRYLRAHPGPSGP